MVYLSASVETLLQPSLWRPLPSSWQKHYGSREGYDLTYQSGQEAHKFDSLYASIAGEMGCSMEAVKRALSR